MLIFLKKLIVPLIIRGKYIYNRSVCTLYYQCFEEKKELNLFSKFGQSGYIHFLKEASRIFLQ